MCRWKWRSELAAGCVVLLAALFGGDVFAQSRVELKRTDSGFQLLRNGQPYSVRGVGGTSHLKTLADLGGNSIRTWSTDNLDTLLDEAHKHGLSVCVGLWLGHERHGFDYQDEASVVKQLADCVAAVKKYKDHPAVLMWGLGNEMEGAGNNPAIWYAIDHIARECRSVDPNHPMMTVVAELGDSKIQNIERFCPNIDIVGVNSYGGVSTMPKRYRAAGGSKPYILTEFGPLGPWEVGKTAWDAPVEASSTEKGERYGSAWRHAVADQAGLSLGAYAFLWGHKQETTATWFGMLLPDGTRLGPADAMSEAWTGKPPANRCTQIEALTVAGKKNLKPGDTIVAKVIAKDPENDSLQTKWVLRQDSGTIGVGGDFQSEEAMFAEAVSAKGAEATVTIPEGGGGYRLFAYVRDGKGGAAVGNLPLFVDAPVKPVPSSKAKLPFALYNDDVTAAPFAQSGYMGNTKAIRMALDCKDEPHSGTSCLKVEYTAAGEWGGVLWQSPAMDWEGQHPGGLDFTCASALEFYVRGEAGGETVSFVLGVLDGQQKYRDSAKAELKDVRLTKAWQKMRIPLEGRDL